MKTDNQDLFPGRTGAWMQLNSGGRFFPQDPKAEEITSNDIANGLASIKRYGGQGDIDKWYSVAEHSVHMAEFVLKDSGWEAAEFALATLMHDASEAFAGDMIRAMKDAVGAPYKTIEGGIQSVIVEKYGLQSAYEEHGKHIKWLDQCIVPLEKEYLFGERALDWEYDKFPPLPNVQIRGWYPDRAKAIFLTLHHLLCDKTGRDQEGRKI